MKANQSEISPVKNKGNLTFFYPCDTCEPASENPLSMMSVNNIEGYH